MIQLTQERLKQVLHYDPTTGVFTWTASTGRRKAGAVAGGKDADGYRRIGIDGARFFSHRLAFMYMTGEFPPELVDHINGIKGDNRFENLRHASNSLNIQNQRSPQFGSKSGYLGVCYDKRRSKWLAQILIGGKRKYLGIYATPEEAHEAYLDAKRQHHEGCVV